MATKTVRIVDTGRGPQIEGHRLTVMDIFYYLHRGHGFAFIQQIMPTLTREQFDAVVEYVNQHHAELIEEDRYVEECIQQGIARQKAKGLYHQEDASAPMSERVERLREKLRRRQREHAEKDGGHPPG